MDAYGTPPGMDSFAEREESPQLQQKYIRNHLIPYNRDTPAQPYEPYSKGIEIKENEIPTYRLGEQAPQRTPIILSVPVETAPVETAPVKSAPVLPSVVTSPHIIPNSIKSIVQEGYTSAPPTGTEKKDGVYLTVIVILLITILFLVKKLYNLP